MYFIVLRENLVPRPQWPANILAAHLAWAGEAFAKGGLRLSGPADGDRMGVYLLEAESEAAARDILDRDPVNTDGYCACRLIEWNIQRGKDILRAG